MGDVVRRVWDALCVAMSRAHRRSAQAVRSCVRHATSLGSAGGGIRAIAVGLALAIGPATLPFGISPTAGASAAPAPMLLTYNTTLGGKVLQLPISGGSVTVNWGDGTTNTALTHTYTSAGAQTVSISGTATRFGQGGLYCSGGTPVALESRPSRRSVTSESRT